MTDNDTSIATTQFVRNAIATYGGGVNAVKTVSPPSNANIFGFWQGSSTSKPGGPPLNATTVTNATANILNITGKGHLRFLSLGRSTGGPVFLTVNIDGVDIISNAQYTITGAVQTYLNTPVVGSVSMSANGTETCLIAHLDETGLTFESSLSITVNATTSTAYVAHAYKLI